jgi:hypothetical protein
MNRHQMTPFVRRPVSFEQRHAGTIVGAVRDRVNSITDDLTRLLDDKQRWHLTG